MHDYNRTNLYIEGAWVPSTGGRERCLSSIPPKSLQLPAWRGIRTSDEPSDSAARFESRRRQARITLIGDTVNVAARVEQLTKTTGDAILLTHQTVDAVDGRPPDWPTGDRTRWKGSQPRYKSSGSTQRWPITIALAEVPNACQPVVVGIGTSWTTETAIVDKPAEEEDHGHGHHHGHAH